MTHAIDNTLEAERAARRRTPSLPVVVAVAIVGLVSATALAQEDATGPTGDATAAAIEPAAGPPDLIQIYESPDIGELKLPGLWEVTDVEDGVRVVEPDVERPVAIEIGALPLQTRIPALALANALLAELTVAAGDIEPTVGRNEPIAAETGERHYLEFEITENSAPMSYAVLVVTTKKKAIFAALASPPERFADLTPRVLLQDIVDSIK